MRLTANFQPSANQNIRSLLCAIEKVLDACFDKLKKQISVRIKAFLMLHNFAKILWSGVTQDV